MKKSIYRQVCLIVAMILTVSCSDNAKVRELLEQIPASADIVVAGNLKTIVESAGGTVEDSKIKIPSNIMEALPAGAAKDIDKANSFLKRSGIDPEACALVVDYVKDKPVVVFAIADKEKFIGTLEDEGFKEKTMDGKAVAYVKKVFEGYEPEYDDYGYVVVNGSYAYWMDRVWVGSSFKPLQYLQELVEEAEDKNVASTDYGDYMTDGNAGGIAFRFPEKIKMELRKSGLPSDVLSMYDGVICLRSELSDDKCTVGMRMYDKDGKEMSHDIYKEYMDVSSTINPDALALLGKDECMIYAASLKGVNWDKYSELVSGMAGLSRADRAGLDAVFSYMEKINGTVAIGFGLTNGMESIDNISDGRDPMAQFSTTIVVETKEGKAARLMDDMKGLLENMGMPFEETGSGFSINLGRADMPDGSLYARQSGNFIAVANHPVKDSNDNPLVREAELSDYLGAFCIGLDKDNRLMKDLKIDNNVKFLLCSKPKTFETELTLEVDGDGNAGVLAKIAKIIIGIASRTSGTDYASDGNTGEDTDVADYVMESDSILGFNFED